MPVYSKCFWCKCPITTDCSEDNYRIHFIKKSTFYIPKTIVFCKECYDKFIKAILDHQNT